jgi:membrane-bound lytic murein transglycosylase D
MNISKTQRIIIFLFLLFSSFSVYSQKTTYVPDTSQSAFEFIKDDFIAASLDSLANLTYFEGFECATEEELKNVFGFDAGYIPVYADSVYYSRLKKLNAASPVNLTYNQYVRDYIDMYAMKKRGLMQRVMGLAQIYFPMFEEQLDRFDMPLELKYLAIVESALNPVAKSRVGATGLWQFMYGTGKAYKLNVTSLVDDRRDPLKSTIAACEHMNDLYKIYDDWLLVLAAYNSGAGNVNKAIRRSGGKNTFWEIRPFLPLETRGYVPAFIAVNYVMAYAAEHNLKAIQPLYQHYDIDTVIVKDVLSFNQIATQLNVPIEEIEFLNPAYKAHIIPATNENTYVLRLQKKFIPDFVNNEAQLYAYRAQSELEKEQILTLTKTVSQAEYHKVKRGENLGLIAGKYKCSVNDLKRWNKLRSTNIQIGQRLIVRPEQEFQLPIAKKNTPPQPAVAKAVPQTPEPEEKSQELAEVGEHSPVQNSDTIMVIEQKDTPIIIRTENVYHKVKPGETMGQLAEKYNTSISRIRVWNNIKGNNIRSGADLIVGKTEVEVEDIRAELAEKKPAKPVSKKSDYVYYTVQRGDTLWKIAQKHQGVSVDDIKKLNNIKNEDQIKPGQKIKVLTTS